MIPPSTARGLDGGKNLLTDGPVGQGEHLAQLAAGQLGEPALAVADELRTGQLVRVEVADLDLSRALHAVWLPTRWPTGPTAELIAEGGFDEAMPEP